MMKEVGTQRDFTVLKFQEEVNGISENRVGTSDQIYQVTLHMCKLFY